MYPLLHQAGFASQPEAVADDDGLELCNLYITNAVKCLPPENRPKADEFSNCRPYLIKELDVLRNLRVIISLGHGAHASLLRLFKDRGLIERLSDVPFGHARKYRLKDDLWLVGCYHTSRYNVQTGRMSGPLFLDLLQQVKTLVNGENG
jgi:uracil-DNA glycosylase family 4